MTEEKEPHEYPNHRVLSIYNKHISADHLALKRDYEALCPHTKVEFKFLEDISVEKLAHIARKRSCDFIMYWETRRHTDLFLYMTPAPQGPTLKMHVFDIKASKSMRFEGNFAKFTRPVMNFSGEFDRQLHMRIVKELLKRSFQAPYLHFKQAPFIDHVFQFVVVDSETQQADFHSYQIGFDDRIKKPVDGSDVLLTEAGPGFSMVPVSIYSGCMCGDVIWSNPNYLTQREINEITRNEKEKQKVRKAHEKDWKATRSERERTKVDAIDDVFSAKTFGIAFGE